MTAATATRMTAAGNGTSSVINTTEETKSPLNSTIAVSAQDNHGWLLYLAIGAASGGVVLLVFIVLLVILLKRRHRKVHQPPRLPKVDEYGLTQRDSTLSHRHRYQPWRTESSRQQDSSSGEYLNDLSPSRDHDVRDRSFLSDHDVYINVDTPEMASDTGSYISCLKTRPDSMPTTIAPGFRPPAGPGVAGKMESIYMPMDLKSSMSLQDVPDLHDIYTAPDEAESEAVYSNPVPCGFPGRRQYVNVPEPDPNPERKEQQQSTPKQMPANAGVYQNVPPAGHVYENLPQDMVSLKKPKVIRSESLTNMESPRKVDEALQVRLLLDKQPPAPSKPDKGAGTPQISAKPGVYLGKAYSMSQVPSSSSSRAVPRVVCKRVQQTPQNPALQSVLPEIESDSETEGEVYQNLEDNDAQAPGKKTEHTASSRLATNKPAVTVSKQAAFGSEKPGTGGRQLGTDGKKPETVCSESGASGAGSKKPVLVSKKPGTVSSESGTACPRGGQGKYPLLKTTNPRGSISSELNQILARRRQNNGES